MEIKIRAFHPDFGMCYMCDPLFDKREFYPFGIMVGFSGYPEYGWTIMLFTGKKDKNKKEIYEGDIVRFNLREGGDGMPAKYGVEGLVVCQELGVLSFGGWCSDYCYDIVVIGNIYEKERNERKTIEDR